MYVQTLKYGITDEFFRTSNDSCKECNSVSGLKRH